MGLKAKAKKFLRAKGITKIKTNKGTLRLANARTIDVVNEAIKLGF